MSRVVMPCSTRSSSRSRSIPPFARCLSRFGAPSPNLFIQYEIVDGCLPNLRPICSTLTPWASRSTSESLSTFRPFLRCHKRANICSQACRTETSCSDWLFELRPETAHLLDNAFPLECQLGCVIAPVAARASYRPVEPAELEQQSLLLDMPVGDVAHLSRPFDDRRHETCQLFIVGRQPCHRHLGLA